MNIQKFSRTHRTLAALAPLALLCLASPLQPTHAQPQPPSQAGGDRITVTLTDPSRPAALSVDVLNGGITIKGGDTREIIVEARVRGSRRDSESQSTGGGMRRLPVSTTGLSVEEHNNNVSVDIEAIQRTVDVTITVPRQTSLKLSSTNSGNILVTDVEGEFDIDNTNGSVTLSNISGSVVAHALNGAVKVTFLRVAQKNMAFSSFNGNVDVTFPADLKASVSFDPGQGAVFTDFDIQLQSGSPKPIVEDSRGHGGKYKVKVDKMIRGSINGGGPEIQLTNFNGNIYLRKATP